MAEHFRMDLYDSQYCFSETVCANAEMSNFIQYSICAYSAKHLGRMLGRADLIRLGEEDYERAMEGLQIASMHPGSNPTETLAMAAVLCAYEFMDDDHNPREPRRPACQLQYEMAMRDGSLSLRAPSAARSPIFWNLLRHGTLTYNIIMQVL